MMESYVSVREVRKTFGSVTALASISFDVAEGEFFTLLGPSGCGKTTLLRCIAGFEAFDAGSIAIAGLDVSGMPPERRDIGFVFQRYALFPSMTVAENVAFGLEMRKLPRAEVENQVAEVLALVGLNEQANRKPRQLSGGQQQRVALARAMVIRPRILLFDEPLSNLDANLRIEMRAEIRRLQKETGITAIYVTHDQAEAFALSDRVVVMSNGEIQQIGTPQELYFRARNAFVANFIGQTNLLRAPVREAGHGYVVVDVGGSPLRLETTGEASRGGEVVFNVRPERVAVGRAKPQGPALRGRVRQVEFLGASVRFHVACDGRNLIAESTGVSQAEVAGLPREGEDAYLSFSPADCTVMTVDGSSIGR